ncbi:2OG-Fe(II) oxygenase [Mucilaginibacter ginsenosidivorans]|uniref:Prolyl 4-hydroxylase subunit alpha n=1 Tax=Mucilaginibacter ginsenosidivorans TaxID=398053 RepID=A0A5B8UVJ7_9SPHI|nr:2OG-Fe(II) oxygenase [Mucilaginibacter ginsenosidivorans]QEC63140.1 prolyl 4-hydroxylase subunit alpha [Mucilaginibacter ginsenosidivorans]
MKQQIDQLDWQQVAGQMNDTGYAIISSLLTAEECDSLRQQYDNKELYRKTIVMERYRFGLGEYKYFNYPLPAIIETTRQAVYPHLAPIANKWMEVLGIQKQFPDSLPELLEQCHAAGQNRPTPLILRYGIGGYNTLHQDLYGDIYFPMQMVLFLDDAYEGGEFVLIEQQPRAQSKAIVLKPQKGDALIFTTNFRPVKGTRGYYRVNMKHGVSQVTSGSRHTLGIIFHDAA